MIFKKGATSAPLPAHEALTFVAVRLPSQYWKPMLHVAYHDILKVQREGKLGLPVYCCVHVNRLLIAPIPAEDTEIRIRYLPPVVEI